MNIGLQIVIQIILGVIGVNLIKKFPSGITKDMNKEIDGYDAPRLAEKNSKMTDNSHHLDNPDVANGTNTQMDTKNATTGRKGIFTPLNNTLGTFGKKVSNSKVGRVGKVATGAAMIAGGAGMAVAAVGAKVAATGIKAADRKLGASRAIKGYAKPIIKKMKFKATSVAGLAKAKLEEEKWALEGQANRIKDFVSHTISDDNKRRIKGAMNSAKHYALQTKKGVETVDRTLKLGADIARNSFGGKMASSGVKMMANAIRNRHGADFSFSNQPSQDKLVNNYHGTAEQRNKIDNVVTQTTKIENTANTPTINVESPNVNVANHNEISPDRKAWNQARIKEVIDAQQANGIDVKNAKSSAAFTGNNYLKASDILRQTASASNLSSQDLEIKQKMMLDLTVNAKKQGIDLNEKQMVAYTEEAFAKTQEKKQEIIRQAEKNAEKANSEAGVKTLNNMISKNTEVRQAMDEYVSTYVNATNHNNNVKNRMSNELRKQEVAQMASELEQGIVSEKSRAILGEQGIKDFYEQYQTKKAKNVFMEKAKIENAEVIKAMEQNPELNITTARNEIEQKEYNQAINEIANKIQTEIPSARKVNVTSEPSNNSVELNTINGGNSQEPITTVASADNNEKVVYTFSRENTQEPIRAVSDNQNAEIYNFHEEDTQGPIISDVANSNGGVNSYSGGNTQEPIRRVNIKIDPTQKVINVGNPLQHRAGTDNQKTAKQPLKSNSKKTTNKASNSSKKGGKKKNKANKSSNSSSRMKKGA